MTERDKLCKKFTELTCGHWHEWKNSIGFTHRPNPTYTNPIDVLGIMKRRDDYRLFKTKIGVKYDDGTFMIASEYILEPDALLRTAVKFLEEKR